MEHLTIKEKQVVQVFWRSEQCLSVSDVTLLLPDESKNTIAAVITKLLKRKLIKVDKVEIAGTALARKFIPTISEEAYYLSVLPSTTIYNLVRHHINSVTDVDYLNSLKQRIHKRN
ncbi:BlaI/MecI/CopY family transcriptional regulator [Enterococcus sp. LJL90]